MRLRIEIRDARDLNISDIQLSNRILRHGNRRLHPYAYSVFAEELGNHLGCSTIQFRSSPNTQYAPIYSSA